MLNNVSIRKKLALILLAPLLVLLALAVLGVTEALDDSSAASDAVRRAEMAQVTTNLFDAIQQESAADQQAVVEAVDLGNPQKSTDAAIGDWRERIAPFADIDSDGLDAELARFAAHRESISAQFGTDGAGGEVVYEANGTLLAKIAAFDARLAAASEDLVGADLLRASRLSDVALSASSTQLLGYRASTGEQIGSPGVAGALAASEADLTSYASLAQTGQDVAENTAEYDRLAASLALTNDPAAVDGTAWLSESQAHASSVSLVRRAILSDAAEVASSAESAANARMRNLGLLALGGILIGLLAAFLIGNSTKKALKGLTVEATAVADHDVPALASAIARGDATSESAERPYVDVGGSLEIAAVSRSINEIRRSAAVAGQEHGELLQTDIADMFVKLARRNQTLVDRQLEVIDELEAQEVDADRLAQMYRVDHLATRMRRNAESLLVLAGNTTARRRGPAVDIREVVRVAIGEVEDYRRIIPIALDELQVAGHAAPDLAHVLSELMENASQSSPPGTVADVIGVKEPDSSYSIRIIDRGTGMDDGRRSELNRILESTPSNTLAMSLTMGLTVVSRLARRLGIDVQLQSGEAGGIVAHVSVPVTVVEDWGAVRHGLDSVATVIGEPFSVVAQPEPEPEPAPAAELLAPEVPQVEAHPVEDVPQLADLPQPPHPPKAADTVAEPAPVAEADDDSVAPDVDEVPNFFGDDEPISDRSIFDTEPVDPVASQPEFRPPPVPSPPPIPATPPIAVTPPVPPVLPTPAASISPAVATPQVQAQPMPTAEQVFSLPSESEPQPVVEAEADAPVDDAIPGPDLPSRSKLSDLAPFGDQPSPEPAITPSGLVRRKRSVPTGEPTGIDDVRASPSKRSPDQVKNMLSRYKTGLERGRTPGKDEES